MIATRRRTSVEEADRLKIGLSPRSCVSDPVSYSAVPIGAPVAGAAPVERAHVKELEDEIRRLRMENEFLKKAGRLP